MSEPDFEDIPEETSTAKDHYKAYLLEELVTLTEWHQTIYSEIIQGTFDSEHLTGYISKLLSLYMHLDTKVAELQNSPDIQRRWAKYIDWQYSPWLPLKDKEAMDMLPDLFLLIREVFERLKITTWSD